MQELRGFFLTKTNDLRVYLKLTTSACCWGGSFVAGKIIVQYLSPAVAAALRFTLAFLVLAAILIAKEGRQAWVHPREWLLLLSSAITGVVLYNLFFFTGLIYTSSINGALIVATGPVITTLMSALFFKEGVISRQVFGLFLSIVGVGVIVSHGSVSAIIGLNFNKGDLIIVGAVFVWSIYTIIGKEVTKRWSSLLATTYACGLGALILWIVSIPQLPQVQWQNIGLPVILSLVFLALFASALAFVFWYDGVGQVGASRAAVFQNVVPVSSAFFSVILLGDKIQLFHGLGAALILYGVYLANLQRKTKDINLTLQSQ